jgi:hypothetical protein
VKNSAAKAAKNNQGDKEIPPEIAAAEGNSRRLHSKPPQDVPQHSQSTSENSL